MAVDKKITELTELTSPVGENLLVIVDDPTGSPVNKKISISNLKPSITVTTESGGEYSCDGTDDDIQLQAALDALETAGGGRLLIEAGNYSLNNFLFVPSNVTVEGEGYATVLTLKDNATGPFWAGYTYSKSGGVISVVDFDENFSAISDTHENVAIRNLTIDVNGANQDVTGYYEFCGIRTDKVKNCRIENVRINNAKWAGIASYVYTKSSTNPDIDNSGLVISGCHFYNCGFSVNGYLDEHNSGGVFFSHGLTGAVIDKCFAYSCQQGFVTEDSATDCTISNNTAYNCTKSGINFRHCRHTKVHHNTCYNNGEHGIFCYGDIRGSTIDNNSCHNNAERGISFGGNGSSAHGNKCYYNGDAGIVVNGTNFTVIGNHCVNNGGGSSPTFAAGMVLNTNTINCSFISNYCVVEAAHTNPTVQKYGLYLANTTYNSLVANKFSGVIANVYGSFSATDKVDNNLGYLTENSGTGTIVSGTTADIITHGLAATPTAQDIIITLKENPTNTPGAIWVDTIGDTYFTVNCENNPGASNLDFGWKASVL